MNILKMFSGAWNSAFKLADDSIEIVDSVEKCVISLGNSKLLVKKGEEISLGQVIAEKSNVENVSVISNVNGTISEITEVHDEKGKKVKAIVVNDIKYSILEGKEIKIEDLTKEEILNKIDELGIMGDEGKSLISVISAFKGNKVQIKVFDTEPNFNYEAIKNILNKELEKGRQVLEKAISNEVVFVDKEANLAKDLLVIDMHTVIRLGEAFLTGQPNIYEYITIFGGAIKANKVYKVIRGITLKELFEKLEGNENRLNKVVVGGALKGNAQFTLEVPVSSNFKSILFLDKKQGEKGVSQNCIRCSKCLRVCPNGLNPIKLVELWNRKEKDEFVKFGGYHCIECGKCSYVCPSKIEIANSISTAKDYIK